MKSACVGVLSIIELKNARWNIEIRNYSLWIFIILRRRWEFPRFFSDCLRKYQDNVSLDIASRLLSFPYTTSVLSHPHSLFDYLKSASKNTIGKYTRTPQIYQTVYKITCLCEIVINVEIETAVFNIRHFILLSAVSDLSFCLYSLQTASFFPLSVKNSALK